MVAPVQEEVSYTDISTTNVVDGGVNTNTVNIYEETLPPGSLDNPNSPSYPPLPTDTSIYGTPVSSTTTTAPADPYAVPSAAAANPYAAPTAGTDPYASAAQPAATADPYGTGANNNPYDMPYESYSSTSTTTQQ